MIVKIRITAQSKENYAFIDGIHDTENPRWKNKGWKEFTFNIKSELIMYCPKDTEADLCKKLLDDYSDGYWKYEYVSHDVLFHESIVLDDTKALDYFKEITNISDYTIDNECLIYSHFQDVPEDGGADVKENINVTEGDRVADHEFGNFEQYDRMRKREAHFETK